MVVGGKTETDFYNQNGVTEPLKLQIDDTKSETELCSSIYTTETVRCYLPVVITYQVKGYKLYQVIHFAIQRVIKFLPEYT